MKHYLIIYFSTLAVMALLDMVWLGGIARGFYKERMGDLMDIHMMPAILFYLMYVAGIVVFANGASSGWRPALLYGALFGFFAYATYDLTNLATLRGWSWTLATVDVVWGACVTGVSAAAGYAITHYLERA